MLTVLAPAKINLTLEVLGKRPDGYHEIRSVMQAISLCDSLTFKPSESIQIRSDSPGWIAEHSLVSKAANLLRTTSGYSRGATIAVSKCIPLMSGLGGDSSDAAATLRGLSQLWRLGLSREELVKLAWQLGSDVAFFLFHGTALVTGRGEIVTPLPPLPHMWVVLAIPPVARQPGKTRELYASLKNNHFTDGRITEELVDVLKSGGKFTRNLLFNTFENVVFVRNSPIGVSRSHMVKMGATNVHLAGSGPALFTLVEDKAVAEDLCHRLKGQRLQPYLAETQAITEE